VRSVKSSLHLLASSSLVVLLAGCASSKGRASRGYVPATRAFQPVAPPKAKVAKTATIVDDGEVYAGINQTGCLTWPSPATKQSGGSSAWGGWYPSNGMVGTVLGSSPHCEKPGTVVYIVDFGYGHVAAIGGKGLKLSGTGAPEAAPPAQVGEAIVRIVAPGKAYDLINSTDCLTWPSPSAKAVGGSSGWGGWKPAAGDVGTAVGKSKHCNQPVTVVFVRLGGRYVAIEEKGVEFVSGSPSSVPWTVPAAAPTTPTTPPATTAGAGTVDSGRVRFVDVGEVYQTINKGTCLTWPDDDVKAEAGVSAWGAWRPSNGDVGVVLWKSKHCAQPVTVLIVRTDSGRLVPISMKGVAPQ
jgi:hypothetical protein